MKSKMYGKEKKNYGMRVKGDKGLKKSVGTPNNMGTYSKIILGSGNRGSSSLTK